jgi:hypothetical protein
MTDTRKKSQRGDYNLEQAVTFGVYDYYFNSENRMGCPVNTYLPGNGLVGQRVSRVNLANNSSDIETMLRGIGTCNMVQSHIPIVPDLRQIKTLDLFETQPTQLPESMVVHRGQRPRW